MISVQLIGILDGDKILERKANSILSKLKKRLPHKANAILKVIKRGKSESIYKASISTHAYGKQFYYEASGDLVTKITDHLIISTLSALSREVRDRKTSRRNKSTLFSKTANAGYTS